MTEENSIDKPPEGMLGKQKIYHDMHELGKQVAPLAEENKRRKESEEAAELKRKEQEAEALEKVRDEISQAWELLPDSETIVVPEEGGTFLLAHKSPTRIRLARSTKDNIKMSGYEPNYQDLEEYENIIFDQKTQQPERIHIFDMTKLKAGDSSKFWGDSKKIYLDGNPNIESLAVTSIPESAPLTNLLPTITESL